MLYVIRFRSNSNVNSNSSNTGINMFENSINHSPISVRKLVF